jgi:two-component system, chemotaxis family, sensor kinase Cph1
VSIPLSPDISTCDQEAIHIPGSIQPHGAMLVVDADTLLIRHSAGNAEQMLGIRTITHQRLADLIGADIAAKAEDIARFTTKRAFVGTLAAVDVLLDVTAHLSGRFLIVEIEPRIELPRSSSELLGSLETATTTFSLTTSLEEMCQAAAVEFRQLTRYDRVMVYRFLDDGAGVVLGEDRRNDLHSFLNHHFPGSDIPRQARELYVRNLIRVIPDVSYTPAALRPVWRSSAPLDMSDCILRSVSPIHLQYLKNMGVSASASISIVVDGMLWGLIACHNDTPRTISYDLRAACIALVGSFARQIRSRMESRCYRERMRLNESKDALMALLSQESCFEDGISRRRGTLAEMIASDGFALVQGDDIASQGTCPNREDIRNLAAWLTRQTVDSVFSTDRLNQFYPDARSFQHAAAGILAVPLSREGDHQLIWFRAERVQTVKWAGNPHKEIELKVGETLSPRASFEAWQEEVHGRSRQWTGSELEAASRLRQELIDLRQRHLLRELNQRLSGALNEKERLLDQKKFLIDEINHRAQNSLRLVSSFLSLQARDSNDAALIAAINEARRRIGAVSLLHRKLYQGNELGVVDAGEYVRELCTSLIALMGPEWEDHFALTTYSLMLPIDRVVPLGLVATELIININKYAYGGVAGPIEITLSEDNAGFSMTVSDKGQGRNSAGTGFGTRLISALVDQLSGSLTLADNKPGLRVVLLAPICSSSTQPPSE